MANIKQTYDELSKNYDLGDIDTFASKMQIPGKRKVLTDFLYQENYDTTGFDAYIKQASDTYMQSKRPPSQVVGESFVDHLESPAISLSQPMFRTEEAVSTAQATPDPFLPKEDVTVLEDYEKPFATQTIDMLKHDDTFWGNLKESWKRGNEGGYKHPMKAYASIFGDDNDIAEVMEERKRLAEVEAIDPIVPENLASDMLQSSARMLSPMMQTYKKGLEAGVMGATAISLAQPETMGSPLALIPAIAQAYSTSEWYQIGAGDMFMEMMEAGVEKDVAKPIALVAGIPYAAIEALQVGKILPFVSRLVPKGLSKQALKKVLANAIVKSAKDLTVNTLEEGFQKAIEQGSTELGKYVTNQLTNAGLEHKKAEELWAEMQTELIEAVKGLAPLSLLGMASGQVNKSVAKIAQDVQAEQKKQIAEKGDKALLETVEDMDEIAESAIVEEKADKQPVSEEKAEAIPEVEKEEKASEQEPEKQETPKEEAVDADLTQKEKKDALQKDTEKKPAKETTKAEIAEEKVETPKEAIKEIIEGKQESTIGTPEFKKRMIAELDKAIKKAKRPGEGGKKRLQELQEGIADVQFKNKKERDKARKDMFEEFGTVKIHIPGDGYFTIVNTKDALEQVKKKVKGLKADSFVPPVKTERTLINTLAKSKTADKHELGGIGISKDRKWYTDADIMIKGNPPKSAKLDKETFPESIPNETIKRIFPENEISADISYYTLESVDAGIESVSKIPLPITKEMEPLIVFKSGDSFYQFSQAKFNLIKKNYPNAKYKIGGTGDKRILVAYEGNQKVGALIGIEVKDDNNKPYIVGLQQAKDAGLIGKAKEQRKPKPQQTKDLVVAEEKVEGKPQMAKDKTGKIVLFDKGKHELRKPGEVADLKTKNGETAAANMISSLTPSKKLPAVKKGKKGKGITTNDVINRIRDIYPNLRIDLKGLQRWAKLKAGHYIVNEGIVETREAFDVGALSHEIAHYFQTEVAQISDENLTNTSEMASELKSLDYDENKKRTGEGFAEFVRMWATGDVDLGKKAPKFLDYFENTLLPKHDPKGNMKELQGALFDFANQDFDAFMEMQSGSKRRGVISNAIKKVKAIVKAPKQAYLSGIAKIAEYTNDEFAVAQYILKTVMEDNYYNLKMKENPIEWMRHLNSKVGAISEYAMNNGIVDMRTGELKSRGIKQIFTDVVAQVEKNKGRKLSKKERWEAVKEFHQYLYARHALDAYKTEYQADVYKDGEYETVTRKMEFKNPGITKIAAERALSENNQEGFEALADEVYTYFDGLLAMVYREGGMDVNQMLDLKGRYPHYIPLYRNLLEDGRLSGMLKSGYASQPKAFKNRVGSEAELEYFLDAWTKHTERVYQWAAKAKVMNTFVNLTKMFVDKKGEGLRFSKLLKKEAPPVDVIKLKESAVKEALEEVGYDVEKDDGTKTGDAFLNFYASQFQYHGKIPYVSVWEKGKRVWYRVDPELYNVIAKTGDNSATFFGNNLSLVEKIMGGASRGVRLGATGINASFIFVRNAMRDMFTLAVQSEKGLMTPFGTITGLISEILDTAGKNSPEMLKKFGIDPKMADLYKRTGTVVSTMAGFDNQAMKAQTALLESSVKKNVFTFGFKHPIYGMRLAFSAMENASRIAEFKAVYDSVLKETNDPEEAIIRAGRAAQDVTTDFARGGKMGKALNKIIPFYNAGVQGINKLYRTLGGEEKLTGYYKTDDKSYMPKYEKDAYGRTKLATKYMMKMVSWVTSMSLLSYLMRDDEKWKDLNMHDRANYFHFWTGSNHIKIPAPFLIGAIFHGGMQTALLHVNKKDEKAIEEYINYMLQEQFSDVLIDPRRVALLGTYFRVKENKDYAGRNIEPKYAREVLHYEDIMKPWTTTPAKKLAKIMPVGELSPVQLEYIMNDLSGGTYNRVFRTFEDMSKLYMSGKNVWGRKDLLPIVGTLFAKDSPMNNKHTARFFNALEEARKKDSRHPHAKKVKDVYQEFLKIKRGNLTEAQKEKRAASLIKKYTKYY